MQTLQLLLVRISCRRLCLGFLESLVENVFQVVFATFSRRAVAWNGWVTIFNFKWTSADVPRWVKFDSIIAQRPLNPRRCSFDFESGHPRNSHECALRIAQWPPERDCRKDSYEYSAFVGTPWESLVTTMCIVFGDFDRVSRLRRASYLRMNRSSGNSLHRSQLSSKLRHHLNSRCSLGVSLSMPGCRESRMISRWDFHCCLGTYISFG